MVDMKNSTPSCWCHWAAFFVSQNSWTFPKRTWNKKIPNHFVGIGFYSSLNKSPLKKSVQKTAQKTLEFLHPDRSFWRRWPKCHTHWLELQMVTWKIQGSNGKNCWWFQIFFIFTPKLGEDFQFDWYFSKGLKPPTEWYGCYFLVFWKKRNIPKDKDDLLSLFGL